MPPLQPSHQTVRTAPSLDGESQFGPHATLQSRKPPSDDELAIQCLLDTAERTALGIWIYPTMWALVAVTLNVHQRWPVLVWGNVAGLLALAVVRLALNRNLSRLLQTHRKAAELAFNGLTLAIAGYWGVLTGLCIEHAPGEPLSWIMLTLTVAFCAGGNTLFGINASLRYPYPLAMIVPVAIAQVMQDTPDQKIMMGLEIVLTLYLRRSSGIVRKDYWDARLAQRLSAQQARDLEMASLTDGLTRVPNRMYFDRQYAYEWARHCRNGKPVSVMIVDLDHFKRVNDTHGHPFGDVCLTQVAQALQASCGRSTDFVARYGGEEFVVLLPDADAAGAQCVAQRMLEAVRATRLQSGGHNVPLTCSIGLSTTTPHHSLDASVLIAEADKALYQAKNRGRDQVVAMTA